MELVVVVVVPQAVWPNSPVLLRKATARTGLSHKSRRECILCCWRVWSCVVQSSIMCCMLWGAVLQSGQTSAMESSRIFR